MQRGPRGVWVPKPGPCLHTSTPARLQSAPGKAVALSAAAPPKEARAERGSKVWGQGRHPLPGPCSAPSPSGAASSAPACCNAEALEWVSEWEPRAGAVGLVRQRPASWPSHCWRPGPCSHVAAAPLLEAQGVPQPPERFWGSAVGPEEICQRPACGLASSPCPHPTPTPAPSVTG